VRGDCSIRTTGAEFSAQDIAACAARLGLLRLELELPPAGNCGCPACAAADREAPPPLTPGEIATLAGQAAALGCRRWVLVDEQQGGDCFSPDRKALVEAIRRRGMLVELDLGGTQITPAMAQLVIRVPMNTIAALPIANNPVPSNAYCSQTANT